MPLANDTFRPLCNLWMQVIRAGWDKKEERFGRDAREGMRFFTGPYDFFWNQLKADRHMRRDGDAANTSEPTYKIQLNKVAELVQLFGPSLYAKNPVRTVTPRELPDLPAELYAMLGGEAARPEFEQDLQTDAVVRQTDAARASLLQTWLNFTPNALDLRTSARRAVEEAIIKGMAALWVEPLATPGGTSRLTGSVHRSIDSLVIDPDARSLAEARWIALRCEEPVWEAEEKYQLPPDTLTKTGHFQGDAPGATSTQAADPEFFARKAGKSTDLFVYWKVWSKMGIGGRLVGAGQVMSPDLRAMADQFGRYCHFAVADGVPYFLNLSPQVLAAEDVPAAAAQAVQWPTPFWLDNGWPFYGIHFHDVPDSPWPMSHLSPAMGEIKFLNWAYSHLATKIRTTSRDFIAVLQSATEELTTKILHGSDLELLRIQESHGKSINEVVQFLQHPAFNGDIWTVISAVMEQFEKRTGLSELMYGSTGGKQIRSGTEAKVRSDQLAIRPDDMADMVEAAMGRGARMEALAARWHLTPDDVGVHLGATGAKWWEVLVYTQDPRVIAFGVQYGVESGSARRKNKDADRDQANQLMQTLANQLYQYAGATGNVDPFNALLKFFGKAFDVRDIDQFLLKNLAPPPVAGPPPNQTPAGAQPPGPSGQPR